jgi:hypothetical protein
MTLQLTAQTDLHQFTTTSQGNKHSTTLLPAAVLVTLVCNMTAAGASVSLTG